MQDATASEISRDRTTILVHYYRAMVGRADMWRTRMDATTNWAIGATAAVISFTLGNASVPHFVVAMAPVMTVSFLLLEARRLTFYHLWQQRVLLLEDGLIRPALTSQPLKADRDAAFIDRLEPHLGTTVPSMSLGKAAARRLRRIYLYLFAVQWLAWVLKLSNHPTAATSPTDIVARASIGAIPGVGVLGVSVACLLGVALIAFSRGGIDRAARERGAT